MAGGIDPGLEHVVRGHLDTPAGPVPVVSTQLARVDHVGTLKARCGWGRMHYRVPPGLYAFGSPGAKSPVLVSANYKLTFDALRRELGGVDAWLLVVDTDGINVWCSAGKGIFSTELVVRSVQAAGLADVVSKRRLVLPQLAAPGVSAEEVRKQTGFYVAYGPVRARDIPAFLAAGQRATDEMRRVTFTARERIVLVPVELAHTAVPMLALALVAFVVGGLGQHGFSLVDAWRYGWVDAASVVGAAIAGVVATPLFLPWIPGRAFSVKGAVAGLSWVAVWMACRHGLGLQAGAAEWLVHTLLLVPLSSFLALGFTGCTPFTSLSGVRLETRRAIPAIVASLVSGVALALFVLLEGKLG